MGHMVIAVLTEEFISGRLLSYPYTCASSLGNDKLFALQLNNERSHRVKIT